MAVNTVGANPNTGACWATNPNNYAAVTLDGSSGNIINLAVNTCTSAFYSLRLINGSTGNIINITTDGTPSFLSPDSSLAGNSVCFNGVMQNFSLPQTLETPSFVQGNNAGATTVFTSAVAEGDLLIAVTAQTGAVTAVSDNINGSWTLVAQNNANTGVHTGLWYFAGSAAAAAGTMTVTATSAARILIAEYTNVASGLALDQYVTVGGNSANPSVGPTAGLASSGELVIGAAYAASATAGAGFTMRQSQSAVLFLEDMNSSSAAGQTATFVASAANWTAIVATFKPLSIPSILVNPVLGGIPQAPTAPLSTNTAQIATTAFVLANAMTTGVYDPATIAQQVVGLTATQTLTNKSLTSPTLTGSPTAPTQTTGDSSTKIATDQFVQTAVLAGAGAASLTYGSYTESSAYLITTTTAGTAVDSTNLSMTFTAPASGAVAVTINTDVVFTASAASAPQMSLVTHGSTTQVTTQIRLPYNDTTSGNTHEGAFSYTFVVEGLTSGTSYHWDIAAWLIATGPTFYLGGSSVSATPNTWIVRAL